jgi:hypothetical protein
MQNFIVFKSGGFEHFQARHTCTPPLSLFTHIKEKIRKETQRSSVEQAAFLRFLCTVPCPPPLHPVDQNYSGENSYLSSAFVIHCKVGSFISIFHTCSTDQYFPFQLVTPLRLILHFSFFNSMQPSGPHTILIEYCYSLFTSTVFILTQKQCSRSGSASGSRSVGSVCFWAYWIRIRIRNLFLRIRKPDSSINKQKN